MSRHEDANGGAEAGAGAPASRDRSARYASTEFPNVVYKGTAIYIRIPSPSGGRVRRRTACAVPRQAAELLGRIDALVLDEASPVWWPIKAVLNDDITIERLAHYLDNPKHGGLMALANELAAPKPAEPKVLPTAEVSALIDEYAAQKTFDAREAGATLDAETVKQYIGHMRTAAQDMRTLCEWTSDAIKAHLDGLEVKKRDSDGDWEMRPVHPSTHRRHLWALRTLCDFLVRKGCLPTNPADSVAPRSMKGVSRKKLIWLTHEEWTVALDMVEEGVVKDVLEFMRATAAEPGAACALTGDKVSDDGASVVINTNRKGGETRRRDAAVDTPFRARLAARALAAGPNRVFPGVSVALLGSTLDRVRSKMALAGFAKHYLITPYELRHTWACEALENGALIHDVSAQLGHAKVSTTLDIYGPGKANAARVSEVRDRVTGGTAGTGSTSRPRATQSIQFCDDVTW